MNYQLSVYLMGMSVCYQNLLFYFFFSTILERRYSTRVSYAATIAYMAISFILRYFGMINETYFYILNIFLGFLFIPYYFIFFKASVIRRILAFSIVVIVMTAGDLCIGKIVIFLTGTAIKMKVDSFDIPFGYLLSFPIFSLCIFIALFLWRTFEEKEWGKQGWKQNWTCIIFPLSQMIMTVSIENTLMFGYTLSAINVVGFALGILADLVMIAAFEAQDRKEKLERKLYKIQYLYELEQIYFMSVEEQQKNMEKIRHDFRNQLSMISYLVEQGDLANKKLAEQLMEQLKADVNHF